MAGKKTYTRTFQVRMSKEEHERFKALSLKLGISLSKLFRLAFTELEKSSK